MSPQEAARLVGHVPPPTASDIDKQWRGWGVVEVMVRNPAVNECVVELEAEIERLRGVLRAVRGSSDPAWAARLINEALGES